MLVVWASIALRPFSMDPAWPCHLLYINTLFQESGMRRNRVQGQHNIYWNAVESVKKGVTKDFVFS